QLLCPCSVEPLERQGQPDPSWRSLFSTFFRYRLRSRSEPNRPTLVSSMKHCVCSVSSAVYATWRLKIISERSLSLTARRTSPYSPSFSADAESAEPFRSGHVCSIRRIHVLPACTAHLSFVGEQLPRRCLSVYCCTHEKDTGDSYRLLCR